MLLSNFLKIGFRPAKVLVLEEESPTSYQTPAIDANMAKKLMDLPHQEHLDAQPQAVDAPLQNVPKEAGLFFEAAVCDPISGEQLGKIRVLDPLGTSGLHSFEILAGDLENAWLTRQTLHLLLEDSTICTAHLAGYPADGGQTGLISL